MKMEKIKCGNLLLKRAALLVSAVLIFTLAAGNSDISVYASDRTDLTEMRGLSAFQIVSDMGAGWNLGNTFEGTWWDPDNPPPAGSDKETFWGNPKTTKAMIDTLAAEGYTTLRIPVRWDDSYSDAASFTVKEEYFNRVETVVNYGLANDMYVILNVHHNDIQTMMRPADMDRVCSEITALWTQIANRFKDYGDKLIFEVINEPRDGEDWVGNPETYECVNECNEAGRAAIRETGGNNEKRLILMPTNCAAGDAERIAAWEKLSDDDMVAVSIHAYLPYDFAFEKNGHSNWTESDLAELKAFFERLYSGFISKDIPVVVDEYGTRNRNNTEDRTLQAKEYIALARQYPQQNIPCAWWDNGLSGTDEEIENFGLFDRNENEIIFQTIVDAMTDGYTNDIEWETATEDHTHSYDGEQKVSLEATKYTDGRLCTYCSADGCDKYKITVISKLTDDPKPEDPDPENPMPEDPDPEDPKPEDPDPEDPKPEDPDPENPMPEDPDPENPMPEDPDPENPMPEDPNPEDPKPEDTKPETSAVEVEVSEPLTVEKMEEIFEANKTRDVVIKSGAVTFTFKAGEMQAVNGIDSYDFSVSTTDDYNKVSGNNISKNIFVLRIDYSYSGKLPAEAEIKIKVGKNYSGKTLYYSLLTENDAKFIMTVVVDSDGYITVKQEHCSSYVLTKNNIETSDESGNPNTGIADVAAVGVITAAVTIIIFKKRK